MNLCISYREDFIFYSTSENQLQKVQIGWEVDRQIQLKIDQANPIEPVIDKFHMISITGLDVCLRKSQIVTCCLRFIKIWNY